MNNTDLRSISIEGVGNCPGGEFDGVTISGAGKITGDLKCQKIVMSGIATIKGDLEAEKAQVSGSATLEGASKVKNFTVSGMAKCSKEVTTEEMCVLGKVQLEEGLKADKISGEGFIKMKGSAEAELMDFRGILELKGCLNCEEIHLELYGVSEVEEIGGSKVHVKEGSLIAKTLIQTFAPKKYRENRLVAQLIEGDDILIENCTAKVVRGSKVKIGKECIIDLVEYTDELDVDPTAVVKERNCVKTESKDNDIIIDLEKE